MALDVARSGLLPASRLRIVLGLELSLKRSPSNNESPVVTNPRLKLDARTIPECEAAFPTSVPLAEDELLGRVMQRAFREYPLLKRLINPIQTTA